MNKTIWTFWENNETHDNFIINKCIKTWYDFNKDWNIIILNNNNLEKYIKNIPNKLNDYSIQNRSDFYRIYILYYYGGVWLDTSIFFLIYQLTILLKIMKINVYYLKKNLILMNMFIVLG